MGNVIASSANGGLNMPPPPPPIPSPSSESSHSFDENGLKNPGTMEELHKDCKDVFPVNFEGAKLVVNKGLSNHFQISHTLNLSSIAASGYRFGATYVGTKQISPTEAFPVLLGDIDSGGNLNAHFIHQVTPKLRTKAVAQIQKSNIVASQLSADYSGKAFTSSLILGNLDVINGSELAYQFGAQVPGSEVAITSTAAKYKTKVYGQECTTSGTLGCAGFHICHYQKASDQLKLGVELETSFRTQESVATIGYQVDLPQANLVFRAMFDSNWSVGACLEKKLAPLPFTFALSGFLSHGKSQFRLGCGLIIG